MIHIAVCDNEEKDLKALCALVVEYLREYPEMDGGLCAFHSPEELLRQTEKQKFDIFLLDIIMPEMNGIEVARAIRRNNRKSQIIFITSTKEFALEAFGVHALQYLEKPVERRRLFEELRIAFDICGGIQKEQVNVTTRDGVAAVDVEDILCVENVARASVYTLRDGRRIESVCNRNSFESSVGILDGHASFIQPHKSYFVNMNCIRQFQQDCFILDNGKHVPISRKRYGIVKSAYLKFLGRG